MLYVLRKLFMLAIEFGLLLKAETLETFRRESWNAAGGWMLRAASQHASAGHCQLTAGQPQHPPSSSLPPLGFAESRFHALLDPAL